MGHLQRFARPTRRLVNKPTKLQAAGYSAALSLLFMVVYGSCNWITAQRHDVGTWYYAWERHIPFVPLLIVPYMSIDLFFAAAPFLCKTGNELRTFAKRISLAILVAGACFLLMPLQLGTPRPQPGGWAGVIFNFLHGFDQPYNLFPSLHITLRTILAAHYVRHSRGAVRWFNRVWFSLIGFSTLLTYQHHIVDIIGGFVLAGICLYVIREEPTRLPVVPNHRVGAYYAVGAIAVMLLTTIGWPGTALLFWPAISLAIVAIGYFGYGPGIYRKKNGRLPFIARWMLAPCLLGQYRSLLYYRRQCAAWNEVTPNVWIGTKLTRTEAEALRRKGVTAVLDLTCEFSEPDALLKLNYLNLPILDLTAPSQSQLQEAVEFITKESASGIVYVHCKVGYSRTAAVVGAYLLATGHANSAAEAVGMLRSARPSIVIRPEAAAAIDRFAQSLSVATLLV